jgi:hypothetical protein
LLIGALWNLGIGLAKSEPWSVEGHGLIRLKA